MQASEEILKKYNVKEEEFLHLATKQPDNTLVSNGTFRLELISDEVGKRVNPRTKQAEDVIWYHFKDENGKLYKYPAPILNKEKTDVHYLVKKLGVLPPSSIVELTYVPNKVGFGGFIDVKVVDKDIPPEIEPEIEL